MSLNIEAFFRIRLKAEHAETNNKVTFPPVHILIEKVKDRSLATCLEFGQSYEANTPSKSALGLIDYMYKYFFITIEKKGRQFLYEQTRKCQYDSIWAEIREYTAKKYDADLEYVEATFQNKSTEELKIIANKIDKNKNSIDDIKSVLPDTVGIKSETDKDKLIAQQKKRYNNDRRRI